MSAVRQRTEAHQDLLAEMQKLTERQQPEIVGPAPAVRGHSAREQIANHEKVDMKGATNSSQQQAQGQSNLLDLSRLEALSRYLESLVHRLEDANMKCLAEPPWVKALKDEPRWCSKLRSSIDMEDPIPTPVLQPMAGLAVQFKSSLPEPKDIWTMAPHETATAAPDLPTVVRAVVDELLTQRITEMVDKAVHPRPHGGSTPNAHASYQPMEVNLDEHAASPAFREPPATASAISKALIPQLQGPLAREIIDALSGHLEEAFSPSGWSLPRRACSDAAMPAIHSALIDGVQVEFLEPRHYEGVESTFVSDMPKRCRSDKSRHVFLKQAMSQGSGMSGRSGSPRTGLVPLTRSPSLASGNSRWSGRGTGLTHTSALESLPPKAFVVNFNRLIFIMKVLNVIHEFINSTVIASLTLVRVGNFGQLWISLGFIVANMGLYTAHSWHYDTMEISDFNDLCQLLGDDDNFCNGEEVHNPNRYIKALSYSRRGIRRHAIFLTTTLAILNVVGLWTFFLLRYEPVGVITVFIVDDDKELMLTLLLVGTLVVVLHACYEWLIWRETQCCMPPSPHHPDHPWDPRIHGLPLRHRLFGLPSMWFTSKQAHTDLLEFISRAKGMKNKDDIIHSIFPQEMALFALDQENSKQLRAVLRHSKLYDSINGQFLTGDNRHCRSPVEAGGSPLELDLELVFFDATHHVNGQKGLGEFMQPTDTYSAGQMKSMATRMSYRDSTFSAFSSAADSHGDDDDVDDEGDDDSDMVQPISKKSTTGSTMV